MTIYETMSCPVCSAEMLVEIDQDSFTGQVWEESCECPSGHYSYEMHYSRPVELVGGVDVSWITIGEFKEQIRKTREKLGIDESAPSSRA